MALLWKMICNLGDPMSLGHPVGVSPTLDPPVPPSSPIYICICVRVCWVLHVCVCVCVCVGVVVYIYTYMFLRDNRLNGNFKFIVHQVEDPQFFNFIKIGVDIFIFNTRCTSASFITCTRLCVRVCVCLSVGVCVCVCV